MLLGLLYLVVLLFSFNVEPRALQASSTVKDASVQQINGVVTSRTANGIIHHRNPDDDDDIYSRNTPTNSHSPPMRVLIINSNDNDDSSIITTENIFLRRRFFPPIDLPHACRIIWTSLSSISPHDSLHATHALLTLFSSLLSKIQTYISNRTPPLSSLQVKYGFLRLNINGTGGDGGIQWDLLAGIARGMLRAVERGLVEFFHVVFNLPRYVDPVRGIMIGVMVGVELIVDGAPRVDGPVGNIVG